MFSSLENHLLEKTNKLKVAVYEPQFEVLLYNKRPSEPLFVDFNNEKYLITPNQNKVYVVLLKPLYYPCVKREELTYLIEKETNKGNVIYIPLLQNSFFKEDNELYKAKLSRDKTLLEGLKFKKSNL